MSEAIVLGEVIAFLGLAPGFVAMVVLSLLHRRLDGLSKPVQRLPNDQFRTFFTLPMVSMYAGAVAGIGASQFVAKQDLLGFVLLMGALFVVIAGGQLAMRPVRRTTIAYRRERLARLTERDWSTASTPDRAVGIRQAGRLASTGRRLVGYAQSRTFGQWLRWQWLRRRSRFLIVWFAVATAYTTGVLVYVLVRRIMLGDWRVGWGSLMIVSLPVMGPVQLWLWYRLSRATLADFGTELRRDASAVLAAIAAAPPWSFRRRAREAIRLLLDLDTNT